MIEKELRARYDDSRTFLAGEKWVRRKSRVGGRREEESGVARKRQQQ